jgi:HD-like signal output (HDOD) protein
MDKINVVEQVKNNLEDMASMPHVAAKALELLNEAEPSSEDLGKVFQLDMVLTGKLLKIVNSAYYGFTKRISTVPDAISILGYDNLRNLLISTIAFDVFSKTRKNVLDNNGLWLHSLAAGTFAQAIAKELNLFKPEEYYISGLLHDVGKVILIQTAPNDYKKVLNLCKEKRISIFEAEQELLGTDHAEIGYIVALHWKLPLMISSSIRFHHDLSYVLPEDDDVLTMSAVAQYSNFVSNIQHMGDSANVKISLLQKETRAKVNIDAELKKKLIDEVKEGIERAKKFFEL